MDPLLPSAPRPRRPAILHRRAALCAVWLLAALGLSACGAGDGAGAGSASAGERGESARSADPRAAELRRALEEGRTEAAAALLDRLEGTLGAEESLLAARLAFLEGNKVGALERIEAARAAWPGDPGPFALAAELYAWMGRLDAAREEHRRGLAVAGEGPELERALGILALVQPGGARSGLAALERARRLDPNLPFVDGPLAEAHRLLGSRAAADGDLAAAEAHARAGLELAPGEVELTRLLADILQGRGRLAAAAELLEDLLARGLPLSAELSRLHHGAATLALTERRRGDAIAHYRRARELGLGKEELGFGTTVLAEEAAKHTAEGRAHYERARRMLSEPPVETEEGREGQRRTLERQWELAEEAFEAALDLDPAALEPLDLLGSVRFRQGRHREAALAWETVLARARLQELELPFPLHLNAARAWDLAGRPDLARQAVERDLERDPEGPFAEEGRAFLRSLEERAVPGGATEPAAPR